MIKCELELKPEGKLTVNVIKAQDLEITKNSRPYAVAYIRPVFKFKTEVIKNNLDLVWNETFNLIAEDKDTQELTVEVFDQGFLLAERLGIAKFRLTELEPGTQKEVTLTHVLKDKDNKNVGSCTVKLLYHQFSEEEQLVAYEEDRRMLKEVGVKRSMKVALNGAFPSFGYRVGRVRKVGSGLNKAGKFIGKTLTQGIATKVEPQLTE